MQSFCIWLHFVGPIEPPDQHEHCVACLGMAHTGVALEQSDCRRCVDLPAHVLRTCHNVTRSLFGVRLTAASNLLVGPPGGGNINSPCHHPQQSLRSPVTFPEDCFHPLSHIVDFVSFGKEEENEDSMSISALDDWVGLECDCPDSKGPPHLQEELVRVMANAVQELELSQSPLEEPAKTKLNFWYFRLTCRQADSRASVPFFPNVHEQWCLSLSTLWRLKSTPKL